MNRRIWGSFSGWAFTSSKILALTCSSRTMSAEIPGSAMLSSSRFISRMASSPSRIILSSSALPVEGCALAGSSAFFRVSSPASPTGPLRQRADDTRNARTAAPAARA